MASSGNAEFESADESFEEDTHCVSKKKISHNSSSNRNASWQANNHKMNEHEKQPVDSAMPKVNMYENSSHENEQFEDILPQDIYHCVNERREHQKTEESKGTNMKKLRTKVLADQNIKDSHLKKLQSLCVYIENVDVPDHHICETLPVRVDCWEEDTNNKMKDMTPLLEKMAVPTKMDALTEIDAPFTPERAESYYEETPGKTPEEATRFVVTYLGLNEDQEKVLLKTLKCSDIDAVLVLKVKETWIPPANVTSDAVLDDIATWQAPNVRRDHWVSAYRWLFHFRNISEIASCRVHILNNHPYCFGANPDLVNLGIIAQQGNIFADAVIVSKIEERDKDVFIYSFFMG